MRIRRKTFFVIIISVFVIAIVLVLCFFYRLGFHEIYAVSTTPFSPDDEGPYYGLTVTRTDDRREIKDWIRSTRSMPGEQREPVGSGDMLILYYSSWPGVNHQVMILSKGAIVFDGDWEHVRVRSEDDVASFRNQVIQMGYKEEKVTSQRYMELNNYVFFPELELLP